MKERVYSIAASGLVTLIWMVFFSPYASTTKTEIALADISVETNSEELSNFRLLFPIEGKSTSDVTSHYGESRGNDKRIHEGMDIPAPKGTPVLAVEDGIIEKVVHRGNGGKQIWLKSGNHQYFYAHLDEWMVKKGQHVLKGEVIGKVGNTGNAHKARPHLHFGIYTGNRKTVNPEKCDWKSM